MDQQEAKHFGKSVGPYILTGCGLYARAIFKNACGLNPIRRFDD